ncbi:MAG: DUF6468 domain-containing protein [Caulobacteraceae bacterium]|nr:DUF6468 domain-containing protein [Caulobacteraceae bacterium]
MSPISIALNLLLAGLLLVTLMFGWMLNRRLKALKSSHAGFAQAVADLDRAASRAEAGLAELRGATDEAIDLLIGRIDKAREMGDRLEVLTDNAERAARQAASRPAPSVRPIRERPRVAPPTPAYNTTEDEALAAAEALILRLSKTEALTTDEPSRDGYRREAARPRRANLYAEGRPEHRPEHRGERRAEERFERRGEPAWSATEDPYPAARAEARPEPRPNPRSRAQVDDDLFEPPIRGGRLRAFDGGLS